MQNQRTFQQRKLDNICHLLFRAMLFSRGEWRLLWWSQAWRGTQWEELKKETPTILARRQ